MNKEKELIDKLIDLAFAEDIGDGDHTTLSCIPATAIGKSKIAYQRSRRIGRYRSCQRIFNRFDPTMKVEVFINDGTEVKPGDGSNGSGRKSAIFASDRTPDVERDAAYERHRNHDPQIRKGIGRNKYPCARHP